ncbi:MAG: hypothetical protein DIU61_016705 [Bacteroidota bacterium]|jgi:hypothetical protein|nr:MAG: hypothetical protein DIU61_11560 [Bacteroidota bacterium]
MSLLFVIAIGILPLQSQQLEPGFYLTQEKATNCEKLVKKPGTRKEFLCLTPRPIIPSLEFRAITEIQEDSESGLYYADLSLSDEGVRILRALASSFRGSTMVLILDNRIAGILDYNEDPFIRENQIRVSVSRRRAALVEVHSQLKAVIAENLKRTEGSGG